MCMRNALTFVGNQFRASLFLPSLLSLPPFQMPAFQIDASRVF